MGRLLILAVVGHAVGIITIVLASGSNAFMMLFLGTLSFGLANGFVEAACNPLIATLYPDQKIKRLNMFHVWFPGGIVIGGLVAYAVDKSHVGGSDHNWQIQMLTMVVPLVIYGFMFIGKKFPATERSASGVSMKEMFAACLKPLYILLLICMTMTAATELVTENWIPNILTYTAKMDGILILVLINGLMAIGRTFAGNIVHKISPVALLIGSASFGVAGLFLLTKADSPVTAVAAAIIFAIGVCYFWPTMLGVTSERFPRTGALGIGLMGAIGSFSVAMWTPLVGKVFDSGIADAVKAGQTQAEAQAAGGKAGLSVLMYLPIILVVVFICIFMYDKASGGYKQVVLVQHQEEDTETPVTAAT
jgi:MFS family permease